MRSPDSKSRIITVTSDAPVSFVHDLEGEDEDDVLADVLDDTIEDDELDRINKQRRNDSRTSSIMELYPYLEFEVNACCHCGVLSFVTPLFFFVQSRVTDHYAMYVSVFSQVLSILVCQWCCPLRSELYCCGSLNIPE